MPCQLAFLSLLKTEMQKGYYRWIPIYLDPIDNTLQGRNWFYDILVHANIWIDFEILNIDELPIWIEEDE